MSSRRFPVIAASVLGVAMCSVLSGPVAYADDTADLQQAVRLFEEGKYLPAQELLSSLDRAQLGAEQQGIRDDYLARVQVAITMYEKSLRDLEDAGTAASEGDSATARGLLQSVLDNEYAPDAARRMATTDLQRLASDSTAAAPSSNANDPVVPPSAKKVLNGTRARILSAEAEDMVSAGRYDEARRLYEDALRSSPGHPEAVAGLARVQEHERNLEGSRGESLIQRIRRENQINWQRTVAEYRDVEGIIREHVSNERFDPAAQLLIRAKQIVESGRQFAEPASKYESLRDEVGVLTEMVQTAERQYNERHVAELRRGIEEQRAKHLKEMAGRRQQQVDALMDQALQHRKDGDLGSAINVLRQVQAVDPKYMPARWMMNDLEDLQQYQHARHLRSELNEQTQRSLNGVEASKIPWFDILRYDERWPEIIARPARQQPGSRGRGRSQLFGALDKRIPVDFREAPFGDVVERFAEANRVNLMVNWGDLKRVGVDRSVPITLSLPREITLKRALTEVLEQAGAGVAELGFDVDDEGVKIASRATLDRRVYTAVYDINDLLMEIPMFNDAPVTDLAQANQKPRPQVADAQTPWTYGGEADSEDTDPDRPARARRIIQLIQEQVAPDSWVGRGGSVGKIDEFNGQLVVTQNSSAQESVGNLLGKLREQRAVQIAVEARFITVTSNYLEDVGIDLDIVLNSGNAGFDFVPGGNGPLTDPVLGSALLLPRTASRLGFAPSVPGNLGTGLTGGTVPGQPFQNPVLIPRGPSGGGGGNLTPVPITNRVTSFTDPSGLGSDVPGSFAGTSLGPALNIFGSFLDNIQVDFLIRATQADSRSTVLTAPQLVMFNGQRSWVAVTIQQNFISQLQPVVATGAVAQAPTTGTINSGAVLDVQATVNSDKRYVTLTLRPGITRLINLQTIPFSGGGAGGGFGAGGGALNAFIQLPTLSSQRVQTTVSVPDGGTLLIGGQKLATETNVEAGVPILSKIPIVKRLYSSRTMVKDEQTLLMLVKPRILIPTEQEEMAFPSFR